jgi:hypothetical protein
MDISVEYPFIMFVFVFETVLILLLTSFSNQIYVEGIGSLPDSPNFTGNIISKAWSFFTYTLNLLTYFFKLLVLPNVGIEYRFLTIIVFSPLVIVLGWIILKTIIPLVISVIGMIP